MYTSRVSLFLLYQPVTNLTSALSLPHLCILLHGHFDEYLSLDTVVFGDWGQWKPFVNSYDVMIINRRHKYMYLSTMYIHVHTRTSR